MVKSATVPFGRRTYPLSILFLRWQVGASNLCARSPNGASHACTRNRKETRRSWRCRRRTPPVPTITRQRFGVLCNPVEIPISSTPFWCRLLVVRPSVAPFELADSSLHPLLSVSINFIGRSWCSRYTTLDASHVLFILASLWNAPLFGAVDYRYVLCPGLLITVRSSMVFIFTWSPDHGFLPSL